MTDYVLLLSFFLLVSAAKFGAPFFGRNQLTGLSGSQFLILYPASLSSASSASSIICHTIFVTHHHSHNIFSPTFSVTQHLLHTKFLKHYTSHTTYFVAHPIVYTHLSHSLCFTHHLCPKRLHTIFVTNDY